MGSRALERSGHRVVAYDARGQRPLVAREAYGYRELAADLEAVLDDRRGSSARRSTAPRWAPTRSSLRPRPPRRVAALVIATPAFDPDGDPRLDHWDRLSAGLREGGVDGFVAAYGGPPVPERFKDTVERVIRQRLGAHEHPEAVADALAGVPRSRPFESWDTLADLGVPAVVVASRDEADPEHPYAVGQRYAQAIPGARLVSEEPGASPLAWQGGQLSKVIAEAAAID
jgi:hypothetical protein